VRKKIKILRYYIGTVEIEWDNIPAKQFVKIGSGCLADIHRIMLRWKSTSRNYKI